MYHDSVLKSSECEATFQTFQESMTVSDKDVTYVETKTSKQQKSACWFESRKDRIKVSQFGDVIKRRVFNKFSQECVRISSHNLFSVTT